MSFSSFVINKPLLSPLRSVSKIRFKFRSQLELLPQTRNLLTHRLHCSGKCPNTEFSWSVFSCICIRENSVFGHFFRGYYHCVKSVQIRSSFCSVFSCIWTEYRKYGPEKTPYLDTFHAAYHSQRQ